MSTHVRTIQVCFFLFVCFCFLFGGIVVSASGPNFPLFLNNPVGFTPWLLYISTPHAPEGFIQLKPGWARDAWLLCSYENWNFHLHIVSRWPNKETCVCVVLILKWQHHHFHLLMMPEALFSQKSRPIVFSVCITRRKRSQVIANFQSSCPPEWHGLIMSNFLVGPYYLRITYTCIKAAK